MPGNAHNDLVFPKNCTEEEYKQVIARAKLRGVRYCHECKKFRKRFCFVCFRCRLSCCHDKERTDTHDVPEFVEAQSHTPTTNATIDGLMKLFKLDFNIKDRYRRGLADGARSNRSPQSEATATLSSYHDPHHHASSPSSPSALVSANSSSSRDGRDERMEQWNHFGSSPLEAANSQPYAQLHARGIGRLNGGGGQDYGYDDHHEDDASNDGYMSSSSSSSGGSLSSSSALSPSSSHSSDDDDYDDDDDMQGGGGGGGDYGGAEDSQDNEYSGTHPFSMSSSKEYHDYYQGSHGSGEHGGLLPAAAAPAIEPQSDRERLELEARQRRLERHADKRRQSLNGNQPAPEEEGQRRKQFGGEYREYEGNDDDDDDDDEEDEDEEEDEDDNEDDIEEGDEDEHEDYDGGNESQHYYDDVYNDAEGEEYDPIVEYDYGYENHSNEPDQPEDEHMVDRDLSDGSDEGSEESDGSDGSESDEEQEETYYDGEKDAQVEDYHRQLSSPLSSSIYDDDASVYRDYHYQEHCQVSEDGYQDHLLQSAPPPPPEPSRQVDNHSSGQSMINNMEDDLYFLDAVPEMKLAFGQDYSDDSNHLFGYPINHNIGNSGLHRQASQMASYDAGEGTSMTGYLPPPPPPPPPPPTISVHQPKIDDGRGSSEIDPIFASVDNSQHKQQHKQQHKHKHHQNPPKVVTASKFPAQITFHSHSSPEDQAKAQTQGGSIATTIKYSTL
ncbi:hypothetical protein BGZ88_000330 [Linnemannia elongata]|nr:hypothetical protein BGZ88_000330 [Linnemannia elongata]